MQLSNAPSKIKLPFANSGTKNTIPVASQIGITAGAASYTDGFPPLTFTPVASGGVPPYGADFNGILNASTAIDRWFAAGAGFVYDSAFATDSNVGGYPKGARVLRADGNGYWLNLTDNNTTDPDAGGAGWVPDYVYGIAAITMTGANVTLTATQYSRPIISISGTLSANLQLIFPDGIAGTWAILNNTSGSFTITAKTVSGAGVSLNSSVNAIFGDGVNIYTSSFQISSTSQAQAWTNNTTALSPLRLAEAFQGANQSLTANGWQKTPGGIIEQWCQFSFSDFAGTTNVSVTFPFTFPNAVLSIDCSIGLTAGFNTAVAINESTITTSGFTAVVAEWSAVVQSGGKVRVTAKGY